jgi:hypothetical protein
LRLVARNGQARTWTHQIQLTLCDFVGEAHDTHHPISSGLYFEGQQTEALRRARDSCSTRMPKFLRWFESHLQRNPGGSRHLVGGKLRCADLSLFQMVEGLQYAFPKVAQQAQVVTPLVQQLRARGGDASVGGPSSKRTAHPLQPAEAAPSLYGAGPAVMTASRRRPTTARRPFPEAIEECVRRRRTDPLAIHVDGTTANLDSALVRVVGNSAPVRAAG